MTRRLKHITLFCLLLLSSCSVWAKYDSSLETIYEEIAFQLDDIYENLLLTYQEDFAKEEARLYRIDSLLQLYPNTTLAYKAEVATIKLLINYGYLDEALSRINKLDKEIIKVDDPIYKNRLLFLRGQCLVKLWKSSEGRPFLDKALPLFLDKNLQREAVECLFYWGRALEESYNGELDSAMLILERTIDYAKDIGEEETEIYAQVQLARYKGHEQQYNVPIETCYKAIAYGQKHQKPAILKLAYTNLAAVYDLFGMPEKTINIINQFLTLDFCANNQTDQRYLSTAYFYLIGAYQALGYDNLVIDGAVDNMLKHSLLTKMQKDFVFAYMEAGSICNRRKEHKEAVCYTNKALEYSIIMEVDHWSKYLCASILNIIEESGEAPSEFDVDVDQIKAYYKELIYKSVPSNNELYNYYFHEGDYEKALHYFQKYKNELDSLESIRSQSAIEVVEKKISLEKETELSALKISQRNIQLKNERLLFTLSGLLFIVFGLIFGTWWYFRQRRMREKAIEKLRKQISDNLHDDVGSTLTHLNHLVRKLKKETPSSSNIDLIISKSNYVINSMSDIVWSMNLNEDKVGDFVLKMEEYLNEYQQSGLPDYILDYDDVDILMKLSVEDKYNLFLVFKEAINNIVKHTNSEKIIIHLYNKKDQIHFKITNHFQESLALSSTSHLGQASIKNRINNLQGNVIITNTANVYELNIQIPVLLSSLN